MQAIKKAVFPVAGLGSRFLPATKANPKEMLPIVDKPLIQYAVEEAVAANITEMIFVTSTSKRSIEDHFDTNYELEARLRERDKQTLLTLTKNIIPKGINCIYVRQPEPLGLGDAVLRAKSVIGDEPFAVLLADDLFDCSPKNCMSQLIAAYEQSHGKSIIAVEKLLARDINKYGIVGISESMDTLHKINSIVEKPRAEEAPSNLGVAGRYILTAEIFNCLEETAKDTQGELQLTDAISLLLLKSAVYAYEFYGKRYDCGSKLGYLKATITFALKHPEVREDFLDYLQQQGFHNVTA